MWDNWGWFRDLWTNSWWCASPQYAIQQISKGWRKQTKTKSFNDNRTSKHSLVSKDSHIKMLYKIKILPAAQHCTETKDVTVFRQAWHTFWLVSFTKDGQQSTLNITSSRVLQIFIRILLTIKACKCATTLLKPWNCLWNSNIRQHQVSSSTVLSKGTVRHTSGTLSYGLTPFEFFSV